MRKSHSDSGPYGVAKHSGPFAQVPADLLYDKRLNAEAKLVYAVLATHANHKSVCWPKLTGIAAALGVKPPAICAHLTSLVDAGWLVRGQYADDRRRNAYRLVWRRPSKRTITSPAVKQSEVTSPAVKQSESFTGSEVNYFSPSEVKNILSTEQTYGSDSSLSSELSEEEERTEAQPTLNAWLDSPDGMAARRLTRWSDQLAKYREWCAVRGLAARQ